MLNNESIAEVVEESEPLGQTITKISPPDEGYETFTAYQGNVGDPEWQCQAPLDFYGSFSALPWHCQREAMRNAGINTPYQNEDPKSPTNIPHRQRPQIEPPSTDNAPNRLMKYTISSTSKSVNGNEGGSARGGNDECDWKDGRPECVVQSERYEESPIDSNNAENGIQVSGFSGSSNEFQCKGVYNFYRLIYSSTMIEYYDEIWNKTVESAKQVWEDNRTSKGGKWSGRWAGAENGFVLLQTEGKRTRWDFEGTVPPLRSQEPRIVDAREQLSKWLKLPENAGASVLLVVHTHPPEGPVELQGPYANAEQQKALFSWDLAKGYLQRPSADDLGSVFGTFGVIVWGKGGLITVYDSNGIVSKETLRRTCVR